MARLSPTAPSVPGLDVSRDSAWAACSTNTQLSLYRTDALATPAAEATLPGDGPTELLFTGPPSPTAVPRVLVFQQLGEATLAIGYAVPTLTIIGALELVGQVTPLATTHDRVFCCSVERDVPRLISFTARHLGVDPVQLRVPVEMAAAAPDGRFIVATRDGLEGWDPRKQRTVVRFNLPVRKPILGGFANRERVFWAAMAGPSGPLEIYRFSDGRQQAHIDFGGTIFGVASTPQSTRILVAFGGPTPGARPQLHSLDLLHQERREVPLSGDRGDGDDSDDRDPPVAFALVDGDAPAALLATATGQLSLVPLPSGDKRSDEDSPAEPVLRDGPVVLPNMPAPAPSASWRERLRPHADDANDDDEADDEAADGEDDDAKLEHDGPAPPKAAEKKAVAKPDTGKPAAAARAASTAPTSTLPSKPSLRSDHWRDALWAWSLGEQALQLPADAPLVQLAERLSLPSSAALALAAVYANWLGGDGARGAPAQVVAHAMMGAGSPAPRAWAEALGTGELAHAGVVRAVDGRLKLRRAVGRFLDQQAPHVTLREGPTRPTAKPLVGPHRVECADPDDGAELDTQLLSLAARFGRLALITGDTPPRRLVARYFEARLHAALPVLDARRQQPPELPDAPALVLVPSGALPELPLVTT